MDIREHPYADFLRSVNKPSRYLGGEHGELRKDWDAARGRMCLAFPDVYEVGMSHLGYKILYSLINNQPDLLAERAYAPWTDMEQALRARGEPLRSLETWQALSAFDVVGFSLQFELTFTNVLLMLDLGGIPLRTADRADSDPLVLAGGPTATHPEPMAPFFDALLIGDGEERTPQILRLWVELRDRGVPRRERLAQLAALGGVYVPSLYEVTCDPESGLHVVSAPVDPRAPLPVQRAMVEDINRYPFPKDGPVANTETVFDRVSVELARGCTEGCRFCQAGMIYRPVREREPEQVLSVIDHAIKDNGYDSASLTSLSTADYSAISPLIHRATERLTAQRASLSVSSLRAYGLDEDVLDALKASGTKGLTFAPEAGTQRMRDVINKNVTEAQLLETAERVFSRGWDRMKLYFIIGLPTEEDEDVRAIVQTGARALRIGRSKLGKRAKVTVSVSTHVPKPHTPFQWCAMDARNDVLRKQALLRADAKQTGVTLRLHDSAGSWIEGVLARGDRRLADVVEQAYHHGARFDSWDEKLAVDAWDTGFRLAKVDPGLYLGTLPVSARLPWDHIEVGLAEGFLQREYRKALRNRLSPPCGKALGEFVHHTNLEAHAADRRKLICYHCGVACDMQQMRAQRGDFLIQLGAHKPAPPPPATGAGEPGEPAKPRRAKGRRQPPVRPDQGTPVRVRLSFTKVGRAAFCSHLDLVRLLPRLFRRLALPLYYSRGFHAKPVMTFGPALSLGVAGLCEYVDVKLTEDAPVDYQALPQQLTEATIDGIRFLEATPLWPGDEKLGSVIEQAIYVAGIPRLWLAELGLGEEAVVRRRLDSRRSQPLWVRREIDGIGKRVDVDRYLRRLAVGAGEPALEQAGLAGDLLPIELELAITGAGTAKVSEAIAALFDHDQVPARYVRVGLYCERHGQRLAAGAVDALRATTPAAPARMPAQTAPTAQARHAMGRGTQPP